MTYSLVAIAAVLMAFSCAKNISEEIIVPEEEPVLTTYTCYFPGADPETKVTLGSDGKTGWEVGDQIFVHGQKGAKGVTVTLGVDAGSSVSADGQTATFTAAISDPCSYSSTIFVAYPADAVKNNWGEKEYLYWSNRFNKTNAHLITGYNDTQNGGTTIRFINLCACISFIVDGDFDGYTFKGNAGETVGYSTYTVRFNNNGGDKKRYYAYVSGESWCDNTAGPQTSITIPSGWTGADGTTVNKIYIPYDSSGKAEFSSGFTILFLKDGDIVKQVSTSTGFDLSADKSSDKYTAKCVSLGDITSYLKTYTPPVKHDSSIGLPADGSDYDLSKTASANCYIVDGSVSANANKVFKFKAYKGKGTNQVGKIASVEVLWETKNNASAVAAKSVIAAVDYDKQTANEYYEICFKTPETLSAGNAVIAAKNSGGEVLWSWHIWIPSTPITSSTYGISSARMMDRNLGALLIAEGDADTDIDVESCGLFYQWGRKDPFPGPGNLLGGYDSSSATVSGTVNTRSMTSSSEIYKYPNSFVETGADTDDYKDWSTDHSSSLWGSSKNQNDPCPPGWKLPIFSGSTGLWGKDNTDKTALSGYILNTTHHWLRLGVAYDALNPSTTGYVYFPLAGYRTQDNSAYAYAGGRALIWQASGGSNKYAYCLYSDGGFVGYRSDRKARGGNVRCVVDE